MTLATRLLIVALLASGAGSGPVLAADGRSIDWGDLMPAGEKAPLPQFGHMAADLDLPAAEQPGTFRVNTEVIGRHVKLAGFVVPLDVEGPLVRRFLLVPYFGACIHLPPPPPNQIVVVALASPLRLPSLDAIITVEGTLTAERSETDLAGAAYALRDASIRWDR